MCLNLYLFNKLPLGLELVDWLGLPLSALNAGRSHKLVSEGLF